MQKAKSIALILGVLTMSFLVGYLVLATEPTAPPPGGNVPAPLNVGSAAQTKTGDLTVGNNSGTDLTVQENLKVNGDIVLENDRDIYGVDIIQGYNDLRLWGDSARTATIYLDSPTNVTGNLTVGIQVKSPKYCIGDSCITSWPVPGGGGDITAVYAGSGLTGGGTSGSVTLNVGAGTGISVAADTVGLAYPSKSCGSGSAIQSFNLDSTANPTCVAVGGQVPSYTVITVTGYGYYNPSDVDWGAKAYAFCPSGYVRTGCSGYYPGICWCCTACDFYGAIPYGSNGCFAQARLRNGHYVRVDAYCLKIY